MNSIIQKSLIGITAASIEKYLLCTGWERDNSFRNPRMWLFFKKEEPNLVLAFPSNENSIDFYSKIYDTILTLSDLQGDSPEEIIASLKSAYTDRIQFRVISDSTKRGKVSLKYAAQCVEGLRDLVLYAACAEENAQPVCARAYNSAKNYLDKFQFGQTEYGSFVFNVDVQVVAEENEQFYLSDFVPDLPVPREHKIIQRIQTAFAQVESVVARQEKIADVVESAYQNGITANMCDAILKLKPEDDVDVSVETTFRYAEALTHSVQPPVKNTLETIHFSLVDEISKRYRDRILVEDVILRGTVKMLSRDTSADGDWPENTVRLLARVDNRLRSITLHLPPEEHRSACNAFRDDKEVEVTGILDKSQKYWFFSQIDSFTVID